ncbi:hypothetical protein VTK26DRAFT_6362 [Humicola hyalothermophila]
MLPVELHLICPDIMLPLRKDHTDSPTGISSKPGKAKSKPAPLSHLHSFDGQDTNPTLTSLSPPPSAIHTPRLNLKGSHLRLRSDSGLSMHTNQAAFRQYTDYNTNGSLPPRPSHASSSGWDGDSSAEDISSGSKANTDRTTTPSSPTRKSLPDFFNPDIVKLAFSNPETEQKLRQFAESRHDATGMEFLAKVDEYSRSLDSLVSLMASISTTFSTPASSLSLDLSPEVAHGLKSNTRQFARSALPALETLYQDAKFTVEDRLAHELYPEFVKYQLSQILTASLSTSRTLSGEPRSTYLGLGDAFCITDPLQPDNPIVYASDGLLALSGYKRSEVMNKNPRLMQGVGTDPNAACRLGEAVTSGRESVELVKNYRADGTPFWNLLFICPLMERGLLRYYLGGQVNVSESLDSSYQDILDILTFGPPAPQYRPVEVRGPSRQLFQRSTTPEPKHSTDNQQSTGSSKVPHRLKKTGADACYREASISPTRLSTSSSFCSQGDRPRHHACLPPAHTSTLNPQPIGLAPFTTPRPSPPLMNTARPIRTSSSCASRPQMLSPRHPPISLPPPGRAARA